MRLGSNVRRYAARMSEPSPPRATPVGSSSPADVAGPPPTCEAHPAGASRGRDRPVGRDLPDPVGAGVGDVRRSGDIYGNARRVLKGRRDRRAAVAVVGGPSPAGSRRQDATGQGLADHTVAESAMCHGTRVVCRPVAGHRRHRSRHDLPDAQVEGVGDVQRATGSRDAVGGIQRG
jgi:hypothetical protein